MATSTRQLCRSICQVSRNIPAKRKPLQSSQIQFHIQSYRPFSSCVTIRADDSAVSGRAPAHFPGASQTDSSSNSPRRTSQAEGLHDSEYLTPEKPFTASDLSPQERADYEVLPKPDQAQYLKLQNHLKAIFESDEGRAELDALVEKADREIDREGGPDIALHFPPVRAKGKEVGYWAEEEDDEFGMVKDGDDDWSDEYITSVAESELDLHRDVREYTRIAAWDLPLLQKYAKPFTPPTHSTPLRFRYTTHMGEHHPSQSKVVVELSTKDLLSHPSSTYKLSDSQRTKLIKLAGVRYQPSTDILKISSERFPTAAQNKRYLGELIGNLIKEAKDKRDTFQDIPADFRHVKQTKKVAAYPEAWKLKTQTVKQLARTRKEKMLLLEQADEDKIVDGEKLVESYVRVGQLKQAQMLR